MAPSLDFAHFDDVTNSGKVFSTESAGTMIGVKLTNYEKEERERWAILKRTLMNHYREFLTLDPIDMKELLRMRIAPPVLAVEGASARSSIKDKRKKRVYPNAIHEWKNFEHDVLANEFSGAPTEVGITETENPFLLSLADRQSEINESMEAYYLDKYVLTPLSDMGLMRYRLDTQASFIYGKPDAVMLKNLPTPEELVKDPSTQEQVAACCEWKSTQNLLLPDGIEQMIEEYSKALVRQTENRGKRSHGWSRVCHPIGQLVGYMVDNKTPYGILTSGTKTYFLFLLVEEDDVDRQLQITPAWFIGQENYLKAWAYFYKMASGADSLPTSDVPATWLESTPSTSPEEKSDPPGMPPPDEEGGDGEDGEPAGKRNRIEIKDSGHGTRKAPPAKKRKSGQGGGSSKTRAVAELSGEMDISSTPPNDNNDIDIDYPENGLSDNEQIPFIKFNSLTDIESLGWGRNGCTFKATWEGKVVAVKQFDLTKNARAYEIELEAYNRLQDDWGILVPTPFFISESPSGNVRFLGMQLGRPPKDDEPVDDDDYCNVLAALKKKYGFRQMDWSHGENCVYLDDGSKGTSTLVLIDLEDVEFSSDN